MHTSCPKAMHLKPSGTAMQLINFPIHFMAGIGPDVHMGRIIV